MKFHRFIKVAIISLLSVIALPVFANDQSAAQTEVQSFSSVKAILTDIEGTTTSISFVHTVLFPYAKEHVAEYLQNHHEEPNVSQVINDVKEIAGTPDATLDEVTATLSFWMSQDKKITPLKTLQGLMWEEGYRQGGFQGHVYEDAYLQMKRWHERGLPIYVYSSGSVYAQKLLFGHSTYGDINSFFAGNFDTKVGMKKDSSSYKAIAEQLNVAPENILFLSDTVDEIVAAQEAGMQTQLISRDVIAPVSSAPILSAISSFDEINIE